MANGNGDTAATTSTPSVAEGYAGRGQPGLQPVTIGGHTVWFPSTYTPAQIDAAKQNDPHLRALATDPDSYIKSNPPVPESPMIPHTAAGVTPGTPTTPIAGETPRGAPTGDMAAGQVQPQTQQPLPPSVAKDIAMDAANYGRGLLSPFTSLGDINAAATRETRGWIPYSGLPTTGDIDRRFFGPTSTLAPTNTFEREQAAFSRGLGDATTWGALPGATKLAGSWFGAPRTLSSPSLVNLRDFGTTLATGGGSSALAQGAVELTPTSGDPNNPPNALAAFGPTAVGLVSGMGIPRLLESGGGRLMQGASNLVWGNPYDNVIARTGADLARTQPSLSLSNAGTMVRREIDRNIANNQPLAVMLRGGTPPTPGAGGLYGTDLSQDEYDSIFGAGNKPPNSVARALLSDKNTGPAITALNEVPRNARESLTGATIGNNLWGGVDPSLKETLVTDPAERTAVENIHGAATGPAAQAARQESTITRGVVAGTAAAGFGSAAALASYLFHNDPTVTTMLGSMGTAAGAVGPYIEPTARRFFATPLRTLYGARRTLLGGQESLDPSYYMMNPGSNWGATSSAFPVDQSTQ